MIPEPQLTYVLELLKALGPVAGEFVVVGGQAMKFAMQKARATKDIDFVLDVVRLRGNDPLIAKRLGELEYAVVEGSQNFQFQKTIPGTNEPMRVEFMAPEEFRRAEDFRVDIEDGVHARACAGGSIALAESTVHALSGRLPDGSQFTSSIRVTSAHALVMMKLLALDERYRNVRGAKQAQHDREEARTHSADLIAIVTAQADLAGFATDFERQLLADPDLGIRVLKILRAYFGESTSPGILVYEESLVSDMPSDQSVRTELAGEVERALRIINEVSPPKAFFEFLDAVEDSCDFEGNPGLVEEFLGNLQAARIRITDRIALEHLPSMTFGRAIGRGDTFIANASAAARKLTREQLQLLQAYHQGCARPLRTRWELAERFPYALG